MFNLWPFRDHCQKLALALTSNPKTALHSLSLNINSIEDRGWFLSLCWSLYYFITCHQSQLSLLQDWKIMILTGHWVRIMSQLNVVDKFDKIHLYLYMWTMVDKVIWNVSKGNSIFRTCSKFGNGLIFLFADAPTAPPPPPSIKTWYILYSILTFSVKHHCFQMNCD